jgi:hypothetical protein
MTNRVRDLEFAERLTQQCQIARQQALDLGCTIVEVQGNQLLSFNCHGIVAVLKTLPPRVSIPIGTVKIKGVL